MNTVLLETEKIVKKFGGLIALNGVSLTITRGDIFGVIGPNGAGKTTLFNVLSGMYVPDSGKVRFKEKVISGLKPHEICKLGLVRTFQIVKPFLSMTALENVAIGAFAKDSDTKSCFRRAREVVAFVGLEKKETLPARFLTLADQKRLEIAKALATEPTLLLLDEVMSGLNPYEIEEALELLRKIHSGGITLLIIEHVMEVILSLCQTICFLDFGDLIVVGSPQSVATDERIIEAYLGKKT